MNTGVVEMCYAPLKSYKGDNRFSYEYDSNRMVIPPEQVRYFSESRQSKRRCVKRSFANCSCFVSCVLVISLCTGLIIYNVVAYREFQNESEKRIKESLLLNIAEHLDDMSERLEKNLELKLLKRFERKMESIITRKAKLMLGRLSAEKPEVSTSEQAGSGEVRADDELLSLVVDKVQGRVEKLWAARLEERLSAVTEEKVQAEILKWHHMNSEQVVNETRATTVDKMAAKRSKRNAKAKKSGEKRNTSQLSFVHLHGNRISRNRAIVYDSDYNFIWDRVQNPYGNGFRYVLYPNAEGAISRIRIKTRGVYMIYSQIAVQGNAYNSTTPIDCAQQTVLNLASNNTDVILLSSRVTQYNLGGAVTMINGVPYYPMDTKLQMGVFVLSPNDTLRVRINDECEHINYVMNRDYSYFGVLKLG